MRCPHCGLEFNYLAGKAARKRSRLPKLCVLCGRRGGPGLSMIVGVGGALCIDCVGLAVELTNAPDKRRLPKPGEPEE